MSIKKILAFLLPATAICLSLFFVLNSRTSALSWLAFPIGLISLALTSATIYVIYLYVRFETIINFKQFVLLRFGVRTIGSINNSSRCDRDGDSCICGSYQFLDTRGRSYQSNFKICIHWPDHEQWKLIIEGHSLGAKNPVYFLRYFPMIHEMQFPSWQATAP